MLSCGSVSPLRRHALRDLAGNQAGAHGTQRDHCAADIRVDTNAIGDRANHPAKGC